MENIIQLKKDSILRFTIEDENGVDTGDTLEFDLEDVELPLRYQELMEKNKKNEQWLNNTLKIINNRQDVKGKKLYSKNEEDRMKALAEFFKKEEEVYNLFLGENGVQKLLRGRKLGWSSFDEINEIITTYILPKLELQVENINEKIKGKYSIEEQENVLE